MGVKLHMALQGFLIVCHAIAGPLITALQVNAEWANVIHAAIGGLQGLAAWLGQQYNCDGTPQSVPYNPKQ